MKSPLARPLLYLQKTGFIAYHLFKTQQKSKSKHCTIGNCKKGKCVFNVRIHWMRAPQILAPRTSSEAPESVEFHHRCDRRVRTVFCSGPSGVRVMSLLIRSSASASTASSRWRRSARSLRRSSIHLFWSVNLQSRDLTLG
jgi:hypothetical protein